MTVILTLSDVGCVNAHPRTLLLVSTDNYATVTAAGYLNSHLNPDVPLYQSDFIQATYSDGKNIFNPSINLSNGQITLVPTFSLSGGGTGVAGNLVAFGSNDSLVDSAIVAANVLLNTSTAGQTSTTALNAAAAGTVSSVIGAISNSIATMTTGTIAGLKGTASLVGASGGAVYGTYGLVTPTGTIATTAALSPIFGQFNLAGATLTSATLASIWGDYGTTLTSGTYVNARGIAMTNATAGILHSQVYLTGGATNLLELTDNNGVVGPTYVTTPAGAVASGNLRALQVSINGATYFILAAAAYGT